ncbi:MAG TPA: hypothetical protein VK419_03740 [Bryobacteraceae bacterium]|nr:hypothetical protein [Bryobacteraceae bacterium]
MRFALVFAASLLSAADVKNFSKTVPLDANGRFSLDTYKGSIRISAWDRPQVDVEARIVADTSGSFVVPVEDVEIRVEGGGASARVKTDYRKRGSLFHEGSLPFVHYTIRLPRGASVQVKDYKSESEIAGVEGDVEFETYKGTARLDGLRRTLHLSTYKGDIRAIFAAFTAASRVDTYKGTVDLSVPRNASFDLEADLERRATLDCAFPVTIRSSREGSRFRTGVNGGGAELRVSSYRGDIRLRAQ